MVTENSTVTMMTKIMMKSSDMISVMSVGGIVVRLMWMMPCTYLVQELAQMYNKKCGKRCCIPMVGVAFLPKKVLHS